MRKFFNSFVFIPIRSLAGARDDTIFGKHGGEGKSGEPIEMAGSVVILTRLAALSLPFTSQETLSSRAAARDLNILKTNMLIIFSFSRFKQKLINKQNSYYYSFPILIH